MSDAVLAPSAPKRLALFERWLSLWVALCMVAGIALGLGAPGATAWLRGLEFGRESHITSPSPCCSG